MVESHTPQITILGMRIVCCIPIAIYTLRITLLLLFYGKDGYANALLLHHTLPVLFLQLHNPIRNVTQ